MVSVWSAEQHRYGNTCKAASGVNPGKNAETCAVTRFPSTKRFVLAVYAAKCLARVVPVWSHMALSSIRSCARIFGPGTDKRAQRSRDNAIQFVDWPRAIARMWTLGALPDEARRYSSLTQPFLTLTDDQLGEPRPCPGF